MKNKVSLMLMEQLVMVLAFALGAALCLTLFIRADNVTRQTQHREEGALIAQNAVELLKSGGDPTAMDTGDYTLVVEERNSAVPGFLNQAAVIVQWEGETVFSIETAWQEVSP